MDLSPSLVLAVWASGLAVAAALISWWRVVGSGFVRLAAGAVVLLAVPAGLGSGGPLVWMACAACVVGFVLAGRQLVATGALAAASALLGVAAALEGPVVPVVSGAILLGGVTGEMMLGHWYLVDPRLPRGALRTLDVIGLVGAVLDFGVLALWGAIPWAGSDAVMGMGFVALAATTVLLMALVWFALGERGYAGVMAATGLSYLAVLTAIGAAVVGRLLVR